MSQDRRAARVRLNLSASAASVSVAVILVAAKLWALAQTGSLSIAASLADSALDLVASLAGLAAILYAARPPDEDHAFGHDAAEDLAALGQAVLVAGSALMIGWRAIARLTADEPAPLRHEEAGLAVMLLSIALTAALVAWQRRVAARTGSRVVAADSLHYLSDLLPNLGALAALWASARFGVSTLDSIVALGASALLLAGARNIAAGAFHALMDRRAAPDVVARIEAIVRAHPGVRGFHDLKTRTSGARLFIQVHVELDGEQSLREAHDIGAALRRRLLEAFPEAEVIIHKDVAGRR
ncbi:cation diffusion facilitator family transporter [Oceanicella actignis]|uniref:Ferrous-iron efflux pump FieF n=1 Tax=Oceanicella actignis TaxID=1189325 RepID=A0A1M7TEU9_9RHOB|nr:cation diffusion facilitator family transporter [Oceanicella actignis]TYO88566.1 ferrous-iron efflux pump FieF [Oceanicella actignis]SET61644.1 ferrous-iron efflux pump FieF [Oceanicella actignis]SHN69289.1 ferrous-iron efflux pump FieF [Oceanicella actignis]